MSEKSIFQKIIFKMMPIQNNSIDEKIEESIIEEIKSLSNLEMSDRDGRTLIVNAAFYNNINVVKYLISQNVNINSADKMGFTALHAAVQEGNYQIIQLLLNNGAEINKKNIYGNNPIMLASHTSDIKIFELLMEKGANPNQENLFGVSALFAFQAYPEIMRILTKS